MVNYKHDEEKTSQTTITLYKEDNKIVKETNEEFVKEGKVFNLSEFTRFCLRKEEHIKAYKELKNKPKEF